MRLMTSMLFIFKETRHIERKLPSMLKEGEPNLLLVPKGLYHNIHFHLVKCLSVIAVVGGWGVNSHIRRHETNPPSFIQC